MGFSLNFDQKLKKTLMLDKKARRYEWVTGWPADSRSRVDLAGIRDGIPRVLVEVELKKDNPVENVVKIWRWAHKNKIRESILFVQAFSAHYLNDSRSSSFPKKVKQYERAVFIGSQMAQDRALRIRYRHLPIYTTTRKGRPKQFKPRMRRGVIVKAGGGAMLRAAENLGRTIGRLLRSRTRS